MIDFAGMSSQEYADFLSVESSKAVKCVHDYLTRQPEESIESMQERLYTMKDRVTTLFGLDFYATKAEILILEDRIKSENEAVKP